MCAHPLDSSLYHTLTDEKETVLRCVNPVSNVMAHGPPNDDEVFTHSGFP